MNTSLQPLNSHGIPTAPKDAVAYWDNLAAQFARGSVASQIMCGFALIELKQEMGFKQGGFRGQKPNDSVFDSWGEFVQKTFAFSPDTAANRIKMAEGVRANFKKLELGDRFKALLQTHPSEWNAPDTQLLSAALQKATSGLTQADFLQKLGLATGAGGNSNPKPGKRGEAAVPKVDPLLYIENDLISITDENDLTLGEADSVRLARFSRVLKACYDRAESILKARKKA